jgi:hypothetical protein
LPKSISTYNCPLEVPVKNTPMIAGNMEDSLMQNNIFKKSTTFYRISCTLFMLEG